MTAERREGTTLAIPESREIVVPGTGELVNLDDAPAVARALAAVREFKGVVESARSTLEQALVDESVRAGSKTLRYGGLVASIGADSELEWDVTELVKLRDLGLPEKRYGQLVTEEITYKVNAAVAKQIAAANPEYAKVIEQARGRRPKRPYVSVKVP